MGLELFIPLDGAAPIPAASLVAYLSRRPKDATAFVLDLADALIQAKDAIDPDSELEETGDDEPTMGSLGSSCGAATMSQEYWSRGGRLDECEIEDEHGGNICDEPHDPEEDCCATEQGEQDINDEPHDEDELDESHDGREPDHDNEDCDEVMVGGADV